MDAHCKDLGPIETLLVGISQDLIGNVEDHWGKVLLQILEVWLVRAGSSLQRDLQYMLVDAVLKCIHQDEIQCNFLVISENRDRNISVITRVVCNY